MIQVGWDVIIGGQRRHDHQNVEDVNVMAVIFDDESPDGSVKVPPSKTAVLAVCR